MKLGEKDTKANSPAELEDCAFSHPPYHTNACTWPVNALTDRFCRNCPSRSFLGKPDSTSMVSYSLLSCWSNLKEDTKMNKWEWLLVSGPWLTTGWGSRGPDTQHLCCMTLCWSNLHKGLQAFFPVFVTKIHLGVHLKDRDEDCFPFKEALTFSSVIWFWSCCLAY